MKTFSASACLLLVCVRVYEPVKCLSMHRDLLPEAPAAVKTCTGIIYSITVTGSKRCIQHPSTQTPPLPARTELLLYSLRDRIQKKAFS